MAPLDLRLEFLGQIVPVETPGECVDIQNGVRHREQQSIAGVGGNGIGILILDGGEDRCRLGQRDRVSPTGGDRVDSLSVDAT